MLSLVHDNADTILAVTGLVFVVPMVITIWSQFREKACTVPLATSGLFAGALALTGLVYATLGLWAAVVGVCAQEALWAGVWLQRVQYGGQ